MNRTILLFLNRSALRIAYTILLFNATAMQAQEWAFKHSIDSIIESKHYAASTPGISICITQHGNIVFEKQVGLANVRKRIPITAQTRFNIGSISKQFTAACIFLLEERGLLNRGDSVQKYIPELPSFGSTITLNHLLAHTSGLTDHMEVLGLRNKFGAKRLTLEYIIQFFKRAPVLSFKPGERFSYCNTGYMLLASIVEKVSGNSLEEFAKANLFDPLKMSSTSYTNSEEKGMPDGTSSYYIAGKKFKKVKHPQASAMGATGVYGTLRDMAVWNQTFDLKDNGFAQKEFNHRMQTSFQLNDGSKVNYGGGLILKPYKGHRNIEHSGGWNAFLTQFRHLPEDDISVLIATNSTDISPFAICDEISDLLISTAKTNGKYESNLADVHFKPSLFEGRYMDANNVIRMIQCEHDSLKLTNFASAKKTLAILSYYSNKGDSLIVFTDNLHDTIQFKLNPEKKVSGFYWEGGHYFRFNRFYKKLDELSFTAMKLAKGRYYSSLYKQGIRIKVRHHHLKMYPVFFKGFELQAIGSDIYKVKNESIYLRFMPDSIMLGNDWISELELKKVK